MIINHNCCIKLVLLVIFMYDARSHIRQISFRVSSFVLYSCLLSKTCAAYAEVELFDLICEIYKIE